LSARFVAGDNLPDALATCQRINAEGIAVTLDHLGENVTSLEEAAASRDAYLRRRSRKSPTSRSTATFR
jgi:proline dehydrogenase